MASCHTHATCYGIFSHRIRRIHRTSCRDVFPRISQICTDVRVRCSPTEFTEYTEFGSVGMAGMPYLPTSVLICAICGRLFSARSFRAFCGNLFPPTEFTEYTEFGSVGMAGMPYPPTSVNICAIRGSPFSARGSVSSVLICGRLFSARSFRAFCGNIFSPTEFTEFTEFVSVCIAGMPYPPTSVRIRAHLWEALLCQKFLCVPCVLWESLSFHRIHRIHRIWQRGYGRNAIPSYICEHPCHLWEALLCQKFCVFGAFRGSFFTACSVGAAETAAPPGGIHRSSVQISPFHLEPSLLHVLPVLWVRLRHHLRLVDAQPGEHNRRRCERHRHAVVVVGVDRL